MPSFATLRVAAVLSERRGLQRVALDDGSRAYVLTDLIGPVTLGDRVIVNTTAVELGLGTGGWHVVHWNLERDEWARAGPGHIMKLRYTSLQVDTGATEEQHRDVLAEPPDLQRRPVVACGLHSQVACVAVVLKQLAPAARIAYVMTEAAALPLALSDLVADLCDGGMLDLTITAGQAFGGDLEAVNLASALALATVVAGADVIVVAPGPGVVGTGTALGASGLELASIVDTATALGGRAIVALRYSDVDQRARHRGLSRPTLTAIDLVHAPVTLPIPTGPIEPLLRAALLVPRASAHAGGLHSPAEHGEVVAVDVPDVAEILARAGLDVTTMGRRPADDPGFFTVAGAAGVAAARALEDRDLGGSVA